MMVLNCLNGPGLASAGRRTFARTVTRMMLAAILAAGTASALPRPVAAQDESSAPSAASVKAEPEAPAAASQEAQPVSEAQIPPTAAAKKAHDLTPIGMFLAADPVVKGVMALLALASVAVWAILLVRGFGLFLAKRRLRAAIGAIDAAESLAEASARVGRGTAARLLFAAEEELAFSRGLPSEGIKERILIALERVEAGINRRMAAGTGILATVGSIGPFVGLFGTVWGIMRSFIGIANSNTTNLAVVAPGIAEALLATGIGLVAAIPAVVIYNALTRSITGYRALCGDTVALIMRHLSRDLDRSEAPSTGSARSNLVAAE